MNELLPLSDSREASLCLAATRGSTHGAQSSLPCSILLYAAAVPFES